MHRRCLWNSISVCLPPPRSIILYDLLGHEWQWDPIHIDCCVGGILELYNTAAPLPSGSPPPVPVPTCQASSPFTNNHLALLLGNKLLINRYNRKSKKGPRQHFKHVWQEFTCTSCFMTNRLGTSLSESW